MEAFVTQIVFEQTAGACLMGRGKGLDGGYFAQADFDSITLKIFDKADPTVPVNGEDGEELVVADVIYNSLQTNDDRWTRDDVGFNFLHVLEAAHLPKGGRKYRFEYAFLPTGSDEPFYGVFEVPTAGLFSA